MDIETGRQLLRAGKVAAVEAAIALAHERRVALVHLRNIHVRDPFTDNDRCVWCRAERGGYHDDDCAWLAADMFLDGTGDAIDTAPAALGATK